MDYYYNINIYTMDSQVIDELLNVLNAEFKTILKMDHVNHSKTTINFKSQSTYIHFIKADCESTDFDTVKMKIADINTVIGSKSDVKYLIFAFYDKWGYHRVIDGYKYSTEQVGRVDRYFVEFGDHYFIPISDLCFD